MFNLTIEQSAFCQAVKSAIGHILLWAGAGTGKTSTILSALDFIPKSKKVFIMAYSAKIRDEIKAKIATMNLPNVTVNTVHGFGLAAIKQRVRWVKVDGEKFNGIADMLQLPPEYFNFVRNLYNQGRQWGIGINPSTPFTSIESWNKIIDRFDLADAFSEYPNSEDEMIQRGIDYAIKAIKLGIDIALGKVRSLKTAVVDFEDMIYVPVYANLDVDTPDYLFVDETQDLNVSRRLFVKAQTGLNTKSIFVGDPLQAIFGFTGADSESMENIKKEFNAIVMPLTVNFRCGKSIIAYANQWMPALKAWDNSPDGTVDTIEADAFKATDFDVANDAVLCRNNAPLVTLFFSLLRRGVPVHIEGRDFMKNLIDLINKWSRIKTIAALTNKLQEYKTRECEKALRAGKEDKAANIADMVDSILAVSSNMSPNDTIWGLTQKLNDMFVDEKTGEKKPTLTLTSIHKSKGREWNRVFWYGKNLYNPSKYARQDWQVEQENNLMGVAATRAKKELIMVNLYE